MCVCVVCVLCVFIQSFIYSVTVVWDWVVVKMCHVKVLVLCVSVQLCEYVVGVYMSHSKGGVSGSLLEIVVGMSLVCVCVWLGYWY